VHQVLRAPGAAVSRCNGLPPGAVTIESWSPQVQWAPGAPLLNALIASCVENQPFQVPFGAMQTTVDTRPDRNNAYQYRINETQSLQIHTGASGTLAPATPRRYYRHVPGTDVSGNGTTHHGR
jgi:hypothetical protein